MGAEGVARGEDGIELAVATQAWPLLSSLSCLKELLPSANSRTFLALKLQNGGWINSEDRPWGGKRQPRPQEPSSVFWVPCFCFLPRASCSKDGNEWVCAFRRQCVLPRVPGAQPLSHGLRLLAAVMSSSWKDNLLLYFYLSHHKAPVS